MSIKEGDIVRLKSAPDILMTVSDARDHASEEGFSTIRCGWFKEDGNPTYSDFIEDTLEIVPTKEIMKIRKTEEKRKDAKAGASWADKAAKIAALISAAGVIALSVFTAFQTNKIKDLEQKIDQIIFSIKTK